MAMQKEKFSWPWETRKKCRLNSLKGTIQCSIKTFMEESKEKQTSYVKFEGSIPRRVINISDKNILEDLISCSLYYKEGSPAFSDEESIRVTQVSNKMIELSRQYHTPEEVHFFIIWVFYYDYRRNEAMQMPLFKVFKKKEKDTEEAIFFDIDLNTYSDWNAFLDSEKLPASLICVPRNASYVFHSGSLDLIYVTSKASVLSSPQLINSSPPAKYTPFYEVAIPCLNTGLRNIVESIKSFFDLLFLTWKDIKNKFGCLETWSKLLSSRMNSICSKKLSDWSTLLGRDYFNVFNVILNVINALAESNELQHIIGHSEVSKFLENPLSSLNSISAAGVLVTILKIITEILLKSYKIQKNKKIKRDALLPLQNNRTENEKRFERRTTEKEENNLSELEKTLKKVLDKKCSESPEITQGRDTKIPTDVGDVYIWHSVTLPKVTEEMQKVLKKDFNLQPRSTVLYSFVGNEGTIQAVMYFLKESVAICIVPRTPIEEV